MIYKIWLVVLTPLRRKNMFQTNNQRCYKQNHQLFPQTPQPV